MKKLYTGIVLLVVAFSANAQIINIPDANFKNALVNTLCWDTTNALEPEGNSDVDTNNDGEIQLSEALSVQNLIITDQSIASLDGIANFTNLGYLDCANNSIGTLDVSTLPGLWILICSNNQLTSLLVNPTTTVPEPFSYVSLVCANNLLTTLDLGANSYETVSISFNQITSLDLSETPFIYEGYFDNNAMASFDYPSSLHMGYLTLSNNPLVNFTLPPGGDFETLFFRNTQLVSLDLSNLSFCNSLYIDDNPLLESINLNNGNFEGSPGDNMVSIYNNPVLEHVCVNDGEYILNEGGDLITISEFISVSGVVPPNVVVTTYCSFTPAGEYNTITGNIKFDCGGTNINLSNIKVNIDSFEDGFTFTNNSGNYVVYANINQFTVTPEIDNPYFTISPPSATLNFATAGNNAVADFCVSPSGIHPDLDIALLPYIAARPGFDAIYKLIYKNKGTEVQSGSINLLFNDAVLDFVSASPATNSQTLNNLNWDFANLLPFETRTIDFTLNVNTPTEIPPVNISDILAFTAIISVPETDETPDDNADELNQIVVGSIDPNDKAVAEGAQILPSQTDDYLHYLIRFQNTGTFAAENVVIQDRLSEDLDVSTVEIVGASHPFRSTLTYENKLEFFFENINLPDATSDEPGSHGFVAFKIKPAGTVTLGSVIENTAGIYFDFNFPVITNTVSTTVSLLAANAFDALQQFTIYPNPVQNFINIKSPTKIRSVEIRNNLGQMVLASATAATIDVSYLSTGIYLITVNSDIGKSIQKFLKL